MINISNFIEENVPFNEEIRKLGQYMLFTVVLITFTILFLKMLTLGTFGITESSLLHSMMTVEKKNHFIDIMLDFEMREIAGAPSRA